MRFEIGKQTGNILDDVYLLLCHKYHYNSNFQNCSQWFQQLYYFCPCILGNSLEQNFGNVDCQLQYPWQVADDL